ncbi:hypothetical protein BX616_000598 [Lobosporangium transversale]|uniref:Maltase n=1 Tax=Lobosporangium transversale TaxID=64571 RepID=A0A1Y2G5E0_9FUNG|nr:alpha-glucosidase [Lobosporangium transversale]KAF9906845.1 hypothetical protein BX616_000598 [Lobosporangium transversale]ORY95103.1 alpha-glucosidase [Lobosporangium transversale]|eukprot:XP_021875312.1 alpha-glucosidase [Lobosporangium transversale]
MLSRRNTSSVLVLLVATALASTSNSHSRASSVFSQIVIKEAPSGNATGDADVCSGLLGRQECGFVGITKDGCIQRQCCWSPSKAPVPWCFKKKDVDYVSTTEIAARRDCGYMGINAQECYYRGCCWDSTANNLNAPFCFLKQHACKGYGVKNVQESAHGITFDLELLGACVRFGEDVTLLTAIIDFETESRIRIKIVDKNSNRYEIPKEALPTTDSTIRHVGKRGYTFKYNKSPFTFSIIRSHDGEVIFDSSVANMDNLIFESDYLEISTTLPEDANIYGLGEVVASFRRDPNGTRQTMWNRDAATPVNQNVYGSHPFHLEMRNGNAHGVFLRNSNGMDVILTPKKLTYKAIGGVLDFTVFMGPTPIDVINQYTEVIGRPHMPPAWAMGFHQSRYGYGNIEDVNQVVSRYRQENLPLDGVWIDIDYMDSFKDFTYDETRFPKAKVRALAQDLQSNNQSMVLIIDPGIPIAPGYEPYDIGMRDDVFIKTLTGRPIEGRVWPGQTYFPDFFNTNETWRYWQDQLAKIRHDLGDNVYPWIDMNEPSNFCNGSCTKDNSTAIERGVKSLERDGAAGLPLALKYLINNGGCQAPLDEKTIAGNAVHKNGLRLMDTHNLYGHMEAAATHHALLQIKPNKRPFILTRASFAGTGAFAAHWTGDNWSQWDHLYYSIPGILSFGLFGIPFTGSDICGFLGNVTDELCLRWHQLGALAPFSRNHNDIHATDQEPFVWPDTVLPATRQALRIRYSLLPYYYTLFERAHRTGQPLWQPLFFKFSQDSATLDIDKQFLLGDSIMVSPVLSQGQIQVEAYFPGHERWFDFTTHECVMDRDPSNSTKPGEERPHRYRFLKAKAGEDPVPMSILGGSIVPIQNPQLNVAATRSQPVSLIIALDEKGGAHGEMYVDDGESVQNQYEARVTFKLTAGEQLVSHVILKSPSISGGDLNNMTATQMQDFKDKINHGDKVEKVTILGLNFASFTAERKVEDGTGSRLDMYAQGEGSRIQEKGLTVQKHTKKGDIMAFWRLLAVPERDGMDDTITENISSKQFEHRSRGQGRFATTTKSTITTTDIRGKKVVAGTAATLLELNINGIVIPLGDGLNGGLNGIQGQDPVTGCSWEVNQGVNSLTLTGLKLDLFVGWYINWKMA